MHFVGCNERERERCARKYYLCNMLSYINFSVISRERKTEYIVSFEFQSMNFLRLNGREKEAGMFCLWKVLR